MNYKIGYKNYYSGGVHIITKEVEALSIVTAFHKLSKAVGTSLAALQISYVYMSKTYPFHSGDFDYVNLMDLPIYKSLGNNIYNLDGEFGFIWVPILPQENIDRVPTKMSPPNLVVYKRGEIFEEDLEAAKDPYMRDMWGFMDQDEEDTWFDARQAVKNAIVDTKKYKHRAILEK